MKRKYVMLIVLCAVFALCGTVLTYSVTTKGSGTQEKTGDFWASRQPIQLTPEEQETADWLDESGGSFAILRDSLSLITFGQASKFCNWAVVGTVEEVGESMVGGVRVTLSVDIWLYGKPPSKTMTFEVFYYGDMSIPSIEQRIAKPGDRMLIFLTSEWYEITYALCKWPAPENIFFFDFDRTTIKWEKTGNIYTRTHIILDSKEMEEEVIRAAKGYLGFFGENGKRDREKYVEFLCSLLNSPVKRIRYDAESDLMLFYTREPSADLDKLLADDRVRKEVKDYLRFRLRNEKPKPLADDHME